MEWNTSFSLKIAKKMLMLWDRQDQRKDPKGNVGEMEMGRRDVRGCGLYFRERQTRDFPWRTTVSQNLRGYQQANRREEQLVRRDRTSGVSGEKKVQRWRRVTASESSEAPRTFSWHRRNRNIGDRPRTL